MSSLSEAFNAGAANAWVFVPSAIALGALHGLEPGHSKTMMAAFIVAVRGTVAQAVLLGVAATLSHTAIVWAIALTGLYFGAQFNAEANEPYLQIASGVLIVAVAAWMAWRSWRDIASNGAPPSGDHAYQSPAHVHEDDHPHDHGHARDAALPHSQEEEKFESDLLELDPTVYADENER